MRVGALLFLVVGLALSGPAADALVGLGDTASIRGPILIGGDHEFTAANGIRSGSGTVDDPYLITDWIIASPFESAITIRGTTAHVVVAHNFLSLELASLDDFVAGVRIENAANVHVVDNRIEAALHGVHVREGTNVQIARNVIRGIQLPATEDFLVVSNTGVTVVGAMNLRITQNVIDHHGWGISVERDTSSIVIAENSITNTTAGQGISLLRGAGDVHVSGNEVSGGGDGIALVGAHDVRVESNRFLDTGLAFDIYPFDAFGESYANERVRFSRNDVSGAFSGYSVDCRNCVFSQNAFSGLVDGIDVVGSTLLEHNRFFDNEVAIGAGTDGNALLRNNSFEPSNDLHAVADAVILDLRWNWWLNENGPAEGSIEERNAGAALVFPWLTTPPS